MPNIDHAALAHALMPAVLKAGACLLDHRAQGVTAETKRDGSPVSRADREAEQIVLDALAQVAPGVPVIAEEAVSAGRIPSFDAAAVRVEALDGTREYIKGGDDFTVNVALVEHGFPVFGILLAPASGRLFATLGPRRAAAAQVAPESLAMSRTPQFHDIATVAPGPEGMRVLSSRSHRSAETDAFLSKFRVARQDHLGSSLKFGIIAAGEADFYPRLGPTSAWDIAAGHAILAAAGGTVTRLDGTPLTYLDKSRIGALDPFLNPSFIAWGRAGTIPR